MNNESWETTESHEKIFCIYTTTVLGCRSKMVSKEQWICEENIYYNYKHWHVPWW